MSESSGGAGRGGGHGGGGRKYPPGFTKDMLKPYIFGNYQTAFKIFNYLVCIGTFLF